MSHQYPKHAIHCGTCRYWRGNRRVVSASHVEVKDTRDTGACSKPGNVRCGQQMQAYESCSQWTKD